MPEILEAEAARVHLAALACDRTISKVDTPDTWFLRRGTTPRAVRAPLVGRSFVAARRIGKQLILETSNRGPSLGLHLGMSGRVIIDGTEAGNNLIYASNRDDSRWYRFTVHFEDGGWCALRDPRRLGGVELEPDTERFGVDAFDLSASSLERALQSRAALKPLLMDQSRIAGLGNMLVDEILWRAGFAPERPAATLDDAECRALLRAIRTTLRVLGARGGSHTGDLSRTNETNCPRDGERLQRSTVGGRTTFWCPSHQL
jgi:formamidopyrimidine-DNA glycosylase